MILASKKNNTYLPLSPPRSASKATEGVMVHPATARLSGIDDPEVPHLSLKYFAHDHQGFDEWTVAELKQLTDFTRKIQQVTWKQILDSGGKGGNKTGLGYTQHGNSKVLPNFGKVKGFDPSAVVIFFELRVSQRARVHCFRAGPFLFLVWLDHLHEVYTA